MQAHGPINTSMHLTIANSLNTAVRSRADCHILTVTRVTTERNEQRCRQAQCRHVCGRPSGCRGSYTRPLHTAPTVQWALKPPDAREPATVSKHFVHQMFVIFGTFLTSDDLDLRPFELKIDTPGYSCLGKCSHPFFIFFRVMSPYGLDRQTKARRDGRTDGQDT